MWFNFAEINYYFWSERTLQIASSNVKYVRSFLNEKIWRKKLSWKRRFRAIIIKQVFRRKFEWKSWNCYSPIISYSLKHTLCLSLSHTHTHLQYPFFLSHSQSLTQFYVLNTLTHYSHFVGLTHCLPLTLSLTHTHSLSLSLDKCLHLSSRRSSYYGQYSEGNPIKAI